MRISAEKALLVLLGYLHFRRADGMLANSFPRGWIRLTMDDECIAGGFLGNANNAPNWLEPDHARPAEFRFYVRTPNEQLEGVFGPIVDISGVHNPRENPPPPSHTTLKSAQIYVRRGEYYITLNRFEVLTQQDLQQLRQQPGLFPPANYMYVTVPEGEMYRARIQRQWGSSSSLKPGMISRLGNYLRNMYRSN